MTTFVVSNVCSAFELKTIGTKVLDPVKFTAILRTALETYDTTKDHTPGQHFVLLHEGALKYVSAGVGKHLVDEYAYVVRSHRGHCSAFLKREFAAAPTGIAVVVYTLDAYKADPEVDPKEIASFPAGVTHVIVAVLAFAGPKAPLTPYRFVSNLAGGNNDADTYNIEDVRKMAREIIAYSNDWCVVAD